MKKRTLNIAFNEASTSIDYYIFEGEKNPNIGKKVFIIGGVHGNEINGVSVVRKLLKEFTDKEIEKKLTGTIYFIPVVNRSGFEKNKRYVYEDGKDLNRGYGENQNVSFSNFIANKLEEEIFKHCDFGIDVHDAGGMSSLIPHPRIHQNETFKGEITTRKLGKLFGSKIILEREGDENMLAVHMMNMYQIPVLTLEVGGGQKIDKKFHTLAIRGIKNILGEYGFIQYKTKESPISKKQKIYNNREFYKAKDVCEVHFSIQLGKRVKKGTKACEIYYPLSNIYEEVFLEEDGIVFSMYESNVVPRGSSVFSIVNIV